MLPLGLQPRQLLGCASRLKAQLKTLPSPFSDHLSSSHVSSFPLPSLPPPLFFSPPIHCQGGPPRKGRFLKARRRQRLAAAAATTVSGLQITRGLGGTQGHLPPSAPSAQVTGDSAQVLLCLVRAVQLLRSMGGPGDLGWGGAGAGRAGAAGAQG